MNASSSHRTVGPSDRQTVRPSDRRGTVLMEAVVCLPVLLLLVTGILQFARLWEARFFTWLAAYHGARAALVYNEREYSQIETNKVQVFYPDRGVVWLAAVDTLAWMSQTDGPGGFFFPTIGHAPHSARIREQVRIVPFAPDPGDLRFCEEGPGYVRVSVAFRFPLFYSIFDPSAMWRSARDPSGRNPLAPFTGVEDENAAARRKGRLGRTFTLCETVLLPKPWSTRHYPKLSRDERRHLLEASTTTPTEMIPHWWNNDSNDDIDAELLEKYEKVPTSASAH